MLGWLILKAFFPIFKFVNKIGLDSVAQGLKIVPSGEPRLAALSNRRFFGRMNNMEKKINKFIYWTPRVLSIILLLFLVMFSLDVFEPGLTAGQIALGLFMHNIPVFILAIVLWISWKYEIIGGIVFILASIAYMVFYTATKNHDPWYITFSVSLILAVPAFLIGILFLVGWSKKKKIARVS